MAKATKRAVTMETRVAGKDEDDGKGGKSKGDGAKRATAWKRVMVSNNDNKMTTTEITTQHCCRRPLVLASAVAAAVFVLVHWRQLATAEGGG
jgi:hypothetical protein